MHPRSIWGDIVYAVRTMRKNPAFTAAALAALAIGIGANTAIFSVLDAVLLKPLSYPDADRIVVFFVKAPAGPLYGGSATKFNVLRKQTSAFQDVSAYEYFGEQINLTGSAFPEQVRAIRVSADYFRLFGAPLADGRTFTGDEDKPGGAHVAMLSYGLWQRRFGADPGIIGRSISLSGVPHMVVGILGRDFNTELDSPPDIWLPFQIDPNSTDQAHYFNVVARLKPGVSLAKANAQLQLASQEFRARFPKMMGPRETFAAQEFGDAIVSEARSSLLVLAGAVLMVLLIACANVANLLLARAMGRKREVAIRAAVGAPRGRIIRQLLIESVVLSATGGALGVSLGLAGVRALLPLNPGDIPRIGAHGSAITADWRLVVFAAGISVVTGVLFGLVPALDASRTEIAAALKTGGGRGDTGAGQTRTRSLLVMGEVALAVVLLAGAALLVRTFIALRAVDPGFDARNVLTARMSLAGSRFQKASDVNRLVRDGARALQALPGVTRAAATYILPLEGAFGVPFNIVGRTPSNGRYDGRGWIGVSPGYFGVFRIPVLRGRLFNDADAAGAPPVAIVNEAMARQFWPHGDPIGDRVILGKGYGPEFEEGPRQIIGVVGDVHDTALNRTPTPVVYVPLAQVTDGITALAGRVTPLAWIVKTQVEPQSLASAAKKELEQISGGLPLSDEHPMSELVRQSTARANFNMSVLTVFGCSALLLAAIGIYGLMAYSVRQRTKELAIRLALGAEARQLRTMILLQGMRLTLSGIAAGLVAALALTRLISGMLFGVASWDPLVFSFVPLLLFAVAVLAAWLPALRATTIDPLHALRSE